MKEEEKEGGREGQRKGVNVKQEERRKRRDWRSD